MMNASTVLRPRDRPQQRTEALFPPDSDAWRRWSNSDQQALLRRVLDPYIGRLRPGHAQVKMEEVHRSIGPDRYAPHMPC
jgi:hypothetical protein